MRQWREVKARHRDALVFFRVGDFYELFYGDAEEGSRLLGLTLTSRNNGAAARVPLAGVPAKALDDYLGRLVALGKRVAICEQVEDPAEAKGIVRREVVETITPGTVMADSLLEPRRNNYVVAIAPNGSGTGLAALDVSTGELLVSLAETDRLEDELGRFDPRELLLPESAESVPLPPSTVRTVRPDWLFDVEAARDELVRRFRVQSLDGFGFEARDEPLVRAAGALVAYVEEIRPGSADHIRGPQIQRAGSRMDLDSMTRRNLELVEALRPFDGDACLLSVMDHTRTPMGARMLRSWVLRPLLEAEAIWARQDAIRELLESHSLRKGLQDVLSAVKDLERLAAKVSAARATPRDLLGLGTSLEPLPRLRDLAAEARSSLLVDLLGDLDPLEDVAAQILSAIAPDAPATLAEGGVIRSGYDEALDELRQTRDSARDFIAGLQARERERTGIGSLKVGFNKVFGYYLEVTKANLAKVPESYVRKQTLAGAERYFTPELKEWEEKVFGAEDTIGQLENSLFLRLRSGLCAQVSRLQDTSERVASVDVLAGLADLAEASGYVRPEVTTGFELYVRAGRHPVVETMMPREEFIPSDIHLDERDRVIILTGPNMAGKSTVLRQVGLIQLMAQVGSYVPADEARLGICDRIFTRVGASDSLARGQSTFMVEMNETASIIHGATDRSLVLLDEIGRGTSTYDGVSIAWAVSEHLHDAIGAKAIFATHYHELTQLGDQLEGVKNLNVAVRESGDRIVFLRRLEEGGADRSYGIQVARLAGFPPHLIARATELLRELEGTHSRGGAGLGTSEREQFSLFDAPGRSSRATVSEGPDQGPPPAIARFVTKLRGVDIDQMTPLQALNWIAEMQADVQRADVNEPDPQGEDS
ncbi:MAG: DNA mismatch repair protein MutS [Gemmatimonadetes bacterium]|nr:DNA mismatch repair protein MutS [Gemmatimonadota bacterium]